MTNFNRKELIERAKKKALLLAKTREDPRFEKVMGILIHYGLLRAEGIRPRRGGAPIQDFYWVGENLEPRVFECLPALAMRRPRAILAVEFPEDLKVAVRLLKKGDTKKHEFKSIPLDKCDQWVTRFGKKKIRPKSMKTIRMGVEERRSVRMFSQKHNISETEVLRRALESFFQTSK